VDKVKRMNTSDEEDTPMMWKRQVVAIVAVVFLTAPLVTANDYYDDFEDTHPLRLVSYPVHAAGYVLEWLVTRPIHALASQRDLEPLLGHNTHAFDFDEQMRRVGGMSPSLQMAAPPAPIVDSGASRRALEEAQTAAAEARAAAENSRMAADDAVRSAEIADRVARKSTQAFEESLKK
jgi:hypothetical protein